MRNMFYPARPANSQDIWNYQGNGERLACAIVGKFDTQQRLAYASIRKRIGEQAFRELLCEALDILLHKNAIEKPAAWLYWFLENETT